MSDPKAATLRALAIACFAKKVDEARAQGSISIDLKQLVFALEVMQAGHRLLEDDKNVHAWEALQRAFEGAP